VQAYCTLRDARSDTSCRPQLEESPKRARNGRLDHVPILRFILTKWRPYSRILRGAALVSKAPADVDFLPLPLFLPEIYFLRDLQRPYSLASKVLPCSLLLAASNLIPRRIRLRRVCTIVFHNTAGSIAQMSRGLYVFFFLFFFLAQTILRHGTRLLITISSCS